MDAHWDSNIMFIHTSKSQDDAVSHVTSLPDKLVAFVNDVFSM